MRSQPRLRMQEKGVALITILLVVVIATVLGVSMTREQNFAINRARTSFDQGIVRQYAYGGEELARQILYEDFSEGLGIDHLQENWASRELKFDFAEGEIELQIEDLQSRFNINSIMQDPPADDLAIQRFSSLLADQGIDQSYVDRVVDWIDQDNSTNPLGAEDYDYLGLGRPYRTSGQLMADATELRLILDLDKETFAAIYPFVIALPERATTINLNTATAQVLQAVAPGLSLAIAETLVSEREQDQHYEEIGDFTSNPSLSSNAANTINTEGLSVQSKFFQVSVRARYQERYGYLTSIIQRDPTDGSMRVIYRDQSKKILPLVVEG